ncbi:MAG: hypothetical protein M0R37_13970 [Bacteroidales bacterium]|nr:hypothetical protein [Bacteroidales bacterium]
MTDTARAPDTAPDHDAPEPSRRQMLDRIEALYELIAPVLLRLDAIDGHLGRLVANDSLTRAEEHRHGSELAHLRASVDGLACRQGGNGHVPPGCPEAAE